MLVRLSDDCGWPGASAEFEFPTDDGGTAVRKVTVKRGGTAEVPDGAALPDGWEPAKAPKSKPAPVAADTPQEG